MHVGCHRSASVMPVAATAEGLLRDASRGRGLL